MISYEVYPCSLRLDLKSYQFRSTIEASKKIVIEGYFKAEVRKDVKITFEKSRYEYREDVINKSWFRKEIIKHHSHHYDYEYARADIVTIDDEIYILDFID